MSEFRRLCLNMIVKNETANLARCLTAVADHIDCWVIGDTGSTDGTQSFIQDFFAKRSIPGEIHSFPFHNFEQARNAALDCAYASKLTFDYLLFDDADMELMVDHAGFRDGLAAPGYRLLQRTSGGLSYWNTRMVRRDAGARYHGVTHEYIDVPGGTEELKGAWYIDHASGANRVDKFERDIRLLKGALEAEPDNARYWFYLAQSYRDAGRLREAADAYAKRAEMGGWDEEAWMARLQQARCLRGLGEEGGFVSTALQAFNQRPQRAEPLYDLARYHRENGRNHAAAVFAEYGLTVKRPEQDILFIEDYVYTTGLLEEYSIAANYASDPVRKDRGFAACNYLATNRSIADGPRELAWSNLHYYVRSATTVLPSFTARAIDFAPPDGYLPLNPSVCRVSDEILVVQRTVNYRMTEDGLQYRTPDGQPITTRNFLLELNDDLSVRTSSEILPPTDMPAPVYGQVRGFEDLRLFSWRNSLWGLSCVRELTPDGWCEQVLTRIERESHQTFRLSDWRQLVPEGEKVHEKNWMPQVEGDALRFVYLCDPTRILDSEARTIQEEPPKIAARNFRGGSQLIPFDGGWLALIHEVQWRDAERKRYYLHRFVWFDASHRLKRMSRPFYFIRKGVEFAAGLAWHPDQRRLIISFSVADAEAWLAAVGADDVRSCLESSDELSSGRIEQPASLPSERGLPAGNIVEFVANDQRVRFVVPNASDSVMKFHHKGQFYETEELQLIAHHYAGRGTFVDIGANVGNHAIYISKFTAAPRIIAFEPNNVAASLLRTNCSLNNCTNIDLSFLGVALSATAGRYRKETPDPDNLGHTRFFPDAAGEVDAITGDALLRNEPVEFIKLDVEGMEFDVLEGLQETIRRCRPKIFIEIWETAEPTFAAWRAREGYRIVGQYQRYSQIQNYLIEPIEDRDAETGTAERTAKDVFLGLAPFLYAGDSPRDRRMQSHGFDARIESLLSDDSTTLPQIQCFYEPAPEADEHPTLMASLSSMRAAGHPVRLWTYSPERLAAVRPLGVELCDAADVVHRTLYERIETRAEIRYFSDVFRYAVLYEHGGLWMDTDVILLRPFPFRGDHFFNLQWHSGPKGEHFVCGNVIYAEPFSRHMRALYERALALVFSNPGWEFGAAGPKLLSDYLASDAGAALRARVFSPMFFNAIDWNEIEQFERPLSDLADYLNDERVFGIHLWTARNPVRKGGGKELISVLSDLSVSLPPLTELADRFNTDKNRVTGNRHAYARIYERLFSRRRFSTRTVLEIGALRNLPEDGVEAAAISLWQAYFPFCRIIAADPKDYARLNGPRLTAVACDQSNAASLRSLADRLGTEPLDAIIDDGSHASVDQQLTLRELFPSLVDGGWYVIQSLDWQPPGEDPGRITLTKTLLREIADNGKALSLDPIGITELVGQIDKILFFDSHYELNRAQLLGGLVAIRKGRSTGKVR